MLFPRRSNGLAVVEKVGFLVLLLLLLWNKWVGFIYVWISLLALPPNVCLTMTNNFLLTPSPHQHTAHSPAGQVAQAKQREHVSSHYYYSCVRYSIHPSHQPFHQSVTYMYIPSCNKTNYNPKRKKNSPVAFKTHSIQYRPGKIHPLAGSHNGKTFPLNYTCKSI